MTLGHAVFLFAAAVLAGAVNSVAGGGTLLSFPAAIAAGMPPIVANATNAVALVPGSLAAAWAYRRHLTGMRRLTALLAVPAVAGALVGAAILRRTPQRLFDNVVPWLVLGATVLILLQRVLTHAPSSGAPGDPAAIPRKRRGLLAGVVVLQFLVSIYGGYFGAAMGIVMLAFLGHLPPLPQDEGPPRRPDLHQMNALKNILAVIINGAASVDFVAHGLVRPGPALLMAAGAVTGGVVGGRLGQRAPAHQVRRLVVVIGFAMAALLAWRRAG
ncbi:MAG: sulfite exporter TauE/SafE family protein [Pseudomonadota bacterium]